MVLFEVIFDFRVILTSGGYLLRITSKDSWGGDRSRSRLTLYKPLQTLLPQSTHKSSRKSRIKHAHTMSSYAHWLLEVRGLTKERCLLNGVRSARAEGTKMPGKTAVFRHSSSL